MKKIKYIIIIFCIFILTGCSYKYGSTTRTIRHSGFSISDNKFSCDAVYSEKKDYDEVTIFTGQHFITKDGNLYEVSTSNKFSNNYNCKKVNTKSNVVNILDSSIYKGTDNKYYYLNSSDTIVTYEEVPVTDNNYYLYDLLLSDTEVVKVQTINSQGGVYYVLKTDGNIYAYVISGEKENYKITSQTIVYDKGQFGSQIKDFNYKGETSTTFFKTAKNYYRMLSTNSEECLNYADVACNYKLQKDNGLTENYDYILGYNGSTLITNYGMVFTVSN